MCGIVGYIGLNKTINHSNKIIEDAIEKLNKRGPDAKGHFRDEFCEMGHARLSIIDTSKNANQPIYDKDQRYVLVYNGEIYNYLELKKELISKNYNFKSNSDTEVLLYGIIEFGKEFIKKINGFFAFCFYDKKEKYFLLGRDRFGIKPLIYSLNGERLIFSSELKSILSYPIKRDIDRQALSQFFRHTYIPAPRTIVQNCKKLLPGEIMEIQNNKVEISKYYSYYPTKLSDDNYETAQKKIKDLLYKSVERRLVSDVPLGTFLSGGVDSSIISAIAKEYKSDLQTFSLGFKDQPLFDESKYANKIAKHIGSNHHSFDITSKELYQNLNDFLDYSDEPFADSSALNVYLLSKKTRENVSVSLSGDGADELFSGYNKHQALYFSEEKNWKNSIIKNWGGLSKLLPSSRNSKIGNYGRQLKKLHYGLNLNSSKRYLEWASFMEESEVYNLTSQKINYEYLEPISLNKRSINDFLYYDFNLVLDNDMLRKVDMMSMANSLEVRTPFLDHKLVEYVFSLPESYKIESGNMKKILKDTFKNHVPKNHFNRKKHGFEVPLKKWFKNEMSGFIKNEIFENNILVKQGIIKQHGVDMIKNKWINNSVGNNVYHIWSLIMLNNFVKKYLV